MKKYWATRLFICIAAFLFSSSASASLVAGTYDSSDGLVQTGVWMELFNDKPPNFAGSPIYMNPMGSENTQWNISVTRSGSVLYIGGFPGGNGKSYLMNLGSGVLNFTFSDGLTYQANITGNCTWDQLPNTPGNPYNPISNIAWYVQGMITTPGYENWSISGTIYNGTETYNNLAGYSDPIGSGDGKPSNAHGGVFNGASLTLTNTAVPIPAAVWLFGSGLIGLVGIRRKFQK